MPRFPRAIPGKLAVIEGAVWNAAMDALERCLNLTVAYPLQLSDSGGGRVISMDAQLSNVRVKVSGAASGGGKYSAKIQLPPAARVTATGDLAAADLGTDGADCYVFNQKEKGKSTHDLTQSPVVVDTFFGYVYTAADDGKPVVAIDGIDIKDCTTAPASTADFAPAEDPAVYHGLTGAAGEMAASAK
jgi:hypothetical protein